VNGGRPPRSRRGREQKFNACRYQFDSLLGDGRGGVAWAADSIRDRNEVGKQSADWEPGHRLADLNREIIQKYAYSPT
jgi:hypothetical protein